jgi:hypothetical protein
MTRPWLAAIAAIWLASIGLSVIDIRQIDRQRREEYPGANPSQGETVTTPPIDETVVPPPGEAPSMIVMPPTTIVAPPEGVTQMQGRAPERAARPDDLIIGPGIVTHPVAIPHDTPAAPPPR